MELIVCFLLVWISLITSCLCIGHYTLRKNVKTFDKLKREIDENVDVINKIFLDIERRLRSLEGNNVKNNKR